jgi:hypothetical protein
MLALRNLPDAWLVLCSSPKAGGGGNFISQTRLPASWAVVVAQSGLEV